ncbi:MAG: hypothetical protein EZS28_016087 [Streblomastix strix]|uniref:Uncharacterized protein n=1 Tax=Streblomastix strix TaxID=222440 RepID=A0A5J4W0A6_9EUKA|nr:MAG: hypothetical protein EZS28_016087 [Streblomastix strix]
MNRTQLYSVDVHNVVAHLAPNIISFAVRTSFQSKYQMTIELSQLPLIQTNEYIFAYQFAANLNLLHNLIIHNNRFASSVASSPNLLPILIAFTFYNQKDEEYNTVIKSRTDLIREQSIDIVSEVCKHCSEQIQRKDLIEMKFAQSLTLATNIKGGGKEQNISVIKSAKKCIDSIIPLLISAQNDKHSYFSLSSETDEEFEAQGGFEEFNIQL